MSTVLRIVHRTGYVYEKPATASYNEIRMTPVPTRQQRLISASLEITPTPWTNYFVDYWNTAVTAFEVHEKHKELTIVSTSVVAVDRATPRGKDLTWAQLRSYEVVDELSELLDITARVEPPQELIAFVRDHTSADTRPAEFVAEVAAFVRERVAYVPGASGVHTRAAQVWEAGAGVCQDQAHLVIGAVRAAGIPARYVSGYVVPGPAGEIGTAQRGESHAWVQYWDGTWIGLDPTNGVAPGEQHVEVAFGRDYGDVAPLRGIYRGGGRSRMFVEVAVTREG